MPVGRLFLLKEELRDLILLPKLPPNSAATRVFAGPEKACSAEVGIPLMSAQPILERKCCYILVGYRTRGHRSPMGMAVGNEKSSLRLIQVMRIFMLNDCNTQCTVENQVPTDYPPA